MHTVGKTYPRHEMRLDCSSVMASVLRQSGEGEPDNREGNPEDQGVGLGYAKSSEDFESRND